MSVAYLFREYDSMPLIEQKALAAHGRTLDVGQVPEVILYFKMK
jgi:hypothetical protein